MDEPESELDPSRPPPASNFALTAVIFEGGLALVAVAIGWLFGFSPLTRLTINADNWPLHLRGSQYDVIRHKVTHHLGLVTPHNKPFAHEAIESDELHDAMRRHRVLARHGDIFDPLCFADDRDAASLCDAISIELIARFLGHIEQEMAADLPPACRQVLMTP